MDPDEVTFTFATDSGWTAGGSGCRDALATAGGVGVPAPAASPFAAGALDPEGRPGSPAPADPPGLTVVTSCRSAASLDGPCPSTPSPTISVAVIIAPPRAATAAT